MESINSELESSLMAKNNDGFTSANREMCQISRHAKGKMACWIGQ